MDKSVDLTEIKSKFVNDTIDKLDDFQEILDKYIESDYIESSDIDELSRICHSAKSDAQLLNLSEISKTFNLLNDIFKGIKKNIVVYEPFLLELFKEAVNELNDVLSNLSSDSEYSDFTFLSMFNEKLSMFVIPIDSSESENLTSPALIAESEDEQVLKQSKVEPAITGQEDEFADLLSAFNHEKDTEDSPLKQTENVNISNISEERSLDFAVPEPIETFTYDNLDEMLYNDFVEECEELLENLQPILLELQTDKSHKVIDSLFRVLHTLKGTAGFVGLVKFQELAHFAENILDDIRDNKYPLSNQMLNEIKNVSDLLDIIFEKFKNQEPVDITISPVLTKLNTLKNNRDADDDFEEINSRKSETDQLISFLKNSIKQDKMREEVAPISGTTVRKTIKKRETLRVDIEKLNVLIDLTQELFNSINGFSDVFDLGSAKKHLINKSKTFIEHYLPIFENNKKPIRNKFKKFFMNTQEINENFLDMLDKFNNKYNSLQNIFNEMHEGILETRISYFSDVLNKFKHSINDIAEGLNKKVELLIFGEELELDKNILKNLSDPLVHIMRNSIDHGLEEPEERLNNNKSETGKIVVNAFVTKNDLIVTIKDDGKGIPIDIIKKKALEKNFITKDKAETMSEQEILELVFLPGFSSADKVSQLSGRGVGMDVVKNNIEKVNGKIKLESELGQGTLIRITIPLSIVLIPVDLVIICNKEVYIPETHIKDTLLMEENKIIKEDDNLYYNYNGLKVKIFNDDYSEFNISSKIIILDNGFNLNAIITDEIIRKEKIFLNPAKEESAQYEFIDRCNNKDAKDKQVILDLFKILS